MADLATATALESSGSLDELLALDSTGVTPQESLSKLESKEQVGNEEVTPDTSLNSLAPDKKVMVLEKMSEANPEDKDIKKRLAQAKSESKKMDREITSRLSDEAKKSHGKLTSKTQKKALDVYKNELSKKVYESTVDIEGNVVALDPNIDPAIQVAQRQELIDAGDTDLLPLVDPKAKEALELASVDNAVENGNLGDLAKTIVKSDNKTALLSRLGSHSSKLLDLGNPVTATVLGGILGHDKVKAFLPKPAQKVLGNYVKPRSTESLKRKGIKLVGAAASVDPDWDMTYRGADKVLNGSSFTGLSRDAADVLGADTRSNHYRATMDALKGYGVTQKGSKSLRDFRRKVSG